MKRPHWLAIVFGLCAWAGVIAAAVNDIWWPLYVAGGLFVLVGTVALAGIVAARRLANRRAPTVTPTGGDAPVRSEPIAEPPKPSTRMGPRTNVRTAGRRNKGAATAIAFGLALGGSHGCERIRDATRSDDGAKSVSPDAKSEPAKPATPAPTTTTPAEDPALVAVFEHAIKPPQGGDATYEVDPFVAALVYQRVRAGEGPTFTPVDKPKEGGPQAGFVVGDVLEGTLFYRLGLRKGDVIEAMNGVVLTGPDRIGFALDGASNRVELTIWREDVSVVQSYRLTQSLAWTELLAGLTPDGRIAIAEGGVDSGAQAGVDDGRGEGAAPADGGAVPTSEEGVAPADEGGHGSGGGTHTPSHTPTPTPSGGGKLPGGGGGGGGGGGSHTPTPTPTPGGPSPVQCESSAKCTVTKAYFDSLVDNPSRLESQANIVPAIQNDVFSGYKLKSIKPGSSLAKLGFQSNDKITHINGYDLTDDFQAAQLYMGVSSTRVFKIRYERGGAKLAKTVVVK